MMLRAYKSPTMGGELGTLTDRISDGTVFHHGRTLPSPLDHPWRPSAHRGGTASAVASGRLTARSRGPGRLRRALSPWRLRLDRFQGLRGGSNLPLLAYDRDFARVCCVRDPPPRAHWTVVAVRVARSAPAPRVGNAHNSRNVGASP